MISTGQTIEVNMRMAAHAEEHSQLVNKVIRPSIGIRSLYNVKEARSSGSAKRRCNQA